jgi:hypothetical protein
MPTGEKCKQSRKKWKVSSQASCGYIVPPAESAQKGTQNCQAGVKNGE